MMHDLNHSQIALVRRTIAKDCDNSEFDLFMAAAKSYGLDPFRKQIIPLVFNKNKPDKRRMSIVVTRDGLRVIAQRCGDYRPASKPAQIEYDPGAKGPTNPKGIISATVYLWKRDQSGDWYEVVGEADWDEFAPVVDEWGYDETAGKRKPTGNRTVDGNWAKMPKVMITKCAEGQALRAGWPDQIGGLYVEEEMDKALSEMTATEAVEEAARRDRVERVGSGIHLMFDRKMELVPIGQLFDKVMDHIRGMDPEEARAWRDQNEIPLRSFWTEAPGDALALKQQLEKVTKLEAR